MANIRYCDPDAEVGGNGTTNALTGANCAYKSLAIWEAARQAVLTDIEECVCESNGGSHTADTTAVIIDGWTTTSSYYIYIHTSAAGRHDGKWNTGKYRLAFASASNSYAIAVSESYVRIVGLQISADSTSTNTCEPIGFTISIGSSSYYIVSHSILKGINDAYGSGIYLNNAIGRIYNNIIYDMTGNTSYGVYTNVGAPAAIYIYNNTFVNCDYGIRGTAYAYAKNNVFRSNALAPTTNMTAANCGYNATDAASLGYTAQTGDRVSQTFTFADEAGDDFHLAANDAGARNYGISDPGSGLFSDDIDGQTRPGESVWDIGADEYVVAGGGLFFLQG